MRDALIIPLNEQESLVITTDNSGSIGMKEQDHVKVAYDIVGYFSFRVAMMECLAAGAKPLTVVIQNLCGDEAWEGIVAGVEKGIEELGVETIGITGSTESNFTLLQSVVGLNVLGLKPNANGKNGSSFDRLALIGLPLVGNEVIEYPEQVAPLSLFYELSKLEDLILWPVGSKGVGHEIERIRPEGFKPIFSKEVDLYKSGGPSTSFLVGYPLHKEKEILHMSGSHFHFLMGGE